MLPEKSYIVQEQCDIMKKYHSNYWNIDKEFDSLKTAKDYINYRRSINQKSIFRLVERISSYNFLNI